MTNTILKGLDYAKYQVNQFHSAFNHPVSEKPTQLDLERGTSRTIWTGEELVEFLQQSSNNEEEFLKSYDTFLIGLEKAKQKSLGMEYPKTNIEKIIGQSDALVDATYFLLGSFVEIGVNPQPLLDIVQNANMAKLGADGKPIIRESDGKIMKPEGWEAPEPKLKAEIERQINA
jgi:predicted HAD superfamily Cof-like phosphohydrolase